MDIVGKENKFRKKIPGSSSDLDNFQTPSRNGSEKEPGNSEIEIERETLMLTHVIFRK